MSIRTIGTLDSGAAVETIALAAGDLRAEVVTLGARLNDLRLAGTPWPLVLGAATLGGMTGPMRWFGAVVGPVANRLRGARVEIAGQVHALEANDGDACLHGGETGTADRLWQIADTAPDRATLTLTLEDGACGLPGRRELRISYRIAPPATLVVRLWATTDAPTLLNPALHPYWNLDGTPDTGRHRLRIAADHVLPTDAVHLPTGEIRPVAGPWDLRALRAVADLPPLDHNFCLAPAPRPLTEVAELRGARGVCLRIATTAPGLQVHDAREMDTAPWPGLTGTPYGPRAGLALEPQMWPDAPGRAGFPAIDCAAGGQWAQESRYRLVREEV